MDDYYEIKTFAGIVLIVTIAAIVLLMAFAYVRPVSSANLTDHERLATQVAELRSDVQALSTTVADMAGALR